MRASSGLLLALGLTVVVGAGVSAHRLDEYLQAARIDLQPDNVSIDLDLTPGAAIVDAVIATIDRDGNGVASRDEHKGYATEVVRHLQVTLDGTALSLRLLSSTFPQLEALHAGEGTIRLHLTADHRALSSGRHELTFNNRHRPGDSVYLANALVPESTGISVSAQQRTVDQRDLTIEYFVDPTFASVGSSGILVGLVAALLIVRYTRRNGAQS